MPTYRLVLEYDGTGFSGFQQQPGVRTIQEELEDALKKLTTETIRIRFASRTDAGVHALGQIVAFETQRADIPDVGFLRGLTTIVDPRLVVRSVRQEAEGWDPRRTARGKRYRYRFFTDPQPTALDRDRAWWVREPLDLAAMREGAAHLVGHRDFESFRAANCAARHARRQMYAIDFIQEDPQNLSMVVLGSAFCKHMVRIFAGTLVDVGRGRLTPSDIEHILDSRDRSQAGMTAPPHGLCLEEVIYDDRLPSRASSS